METVKEALERLREEIKAKTVRVKPGKALGATTDGAVCAAGFGASVLGQAQSRANFISGVADRHRMRELREKNKSKGKKTGPPTWAQRSLAKKLGIPLAAKCTRHNAGGLIEVCIASRREQRKRSRQGKRR